jgi:NTP pyrophosphatase (non-canonical NTP hydrolase)
MNLKELQKGTDEIINAIDQKLGVKHDSNNTIIHAIEELGELARQINNKNIRAKEQDMDNLAEEISDVILLITRLANIYNIDIEKSIISKIEKLKQRHNL